MAEVKKNGTTTNTKKNVSKKSNMNHNNNKKNYDNTEKKHYDNKKYYGKNSGSTNNKKEEIVKIKKIEIISNDDTDEEEDKKLIIIIALSILVIIGTVIGLLVGCQKEETYIDDTEKDDIVVDVKDEDNLLESEVVTKTTTKVTKTSFETEEKELFNVKYFYGDKLHHEMIETGNKLNEYVPVGYSTCKYYTNEEKTIEYSFDNKISEDTTLYIECNAIEYNVNYVFDEQVASNTKYDVQLETNVELNPNKFYGNDNITLNDLETNYLFLGWYLTYDEETNNYSNRVNSLNRNLYKYVVDNELTLYAKVQENIKVTYLTKDEENKYEVLLDNTNTYSFEENIFGLSNFVGWTTNKESNNLINSNDNLTGDITVYAVCGDAVVMYTTKTGAISVAYTDQELLDEEFELPTPTEIGLEVSTYVIPVSEETLTSKRIVSDDDVEIDLQKQMSLTEATNKAIEGYEPKLGDNIEEKEREFTGWKESDGTFDENDKLVVSEENVTTEDVVEKLTQDENNPARELLVGQEEIVEDSTELVEG